MRRAAYLLLFTCALAHAQDRPFGAPPTRLADTALNHLQVLGDSSSFTRLWQRMDELVFSGTGQVNVVHIGGSHVQADMWDMQLRQRLQTMIPGVRAARGFIFPYNMARSNNPYWYNPEFTGTWTSARNVSRDNTTPLGLAGYAVTTTDTLTRLRITFRGNGYPGYSTDRLRVFHGMDSSYTVLPDTRDPDLVRRLRTVPDSGYTEITYARALDTLDLCFQRTEPHQRRFTLHGIQLLNSAPGIALHSAGVNGASTASWLRCERLPLELASIRPDLVVLSIGINDAFDSDFDAARFARNYDELIQRVRQAAPGTAILLTTNNDSYFRRKLNNPHADAVRRTMLQLGERHGCAVWDLFGIMGGATSMRRWQAAGLAKADRIHFTREGYSAIGDLLYTALMEDYARHLRQQRQHP